MNCLVFPNKEKDRRLTVTNEAIGYLRSKGCECEIFESFTNYEKCFDFALVIGGDGTFLQAAQYCSIHDIPMVGINLGKMGFLTVVETESMTADLNKVITKQYSINERMMIDVYDDKNVYGTALNDIVFKHLYGKGVGQFEIYVNDCLLSKFHGDGVLIAAPTGSTAYCLSMGGPIVNPNCDIILIQPICPHSMNSRTIIINPNEKVSVDYDRFYTFVGYDGQEVISQSRRLNIRKSTHKCKIIQFDDYNFYSEVYNKIQ